MDLLSVPHNWQFEMGAGVVVAAPRSSYCAAELLQNCDLPPPAKVFSPPQLERPVVNQCDVDLMRALQLSQTRAREAEKRASEANMETEHITALLLEDSSRLHAAQQWVRLLEMEVSLMKQSAAAEEEGGEAVGAMTWCLAVALCLGIAGAGFMLGRCIF